MARTIAVVGATGLIGRTLSRALVARGDVVIAVSRRGNAGIEGARDVAWNPADGPPPPEVIDGVEAVVNMAGSPIASGRWTAARKRDIRESRVVTTRLLAERVGGGGAPAVLVNSSAVGFYGTGHGDEEVDETTPPGDDFLAQIGVAWERATGPALERGARVVLVRTGLVLDRDEGILPRLAMLSRLMIGGPVGGGDQWMPWIHIDDEVAVLMRALDDPEMSGPVNATAPAPVRQREFMDTLGRVLGRPSFMPTPAFPLRLGMGEMSTLLLDGQRAVPGVLRERGFTFAHPELEPALRAALGRPE
jgi:uncharacterized protein (TIGR01777 family)